MTMSWLTLGTHSLERIKSALADVLVTPRLIHPTVAEHGRLHRRRRRTILPFRPAVVAVCDIGRAFVAGNVNPGCSAGLLHLNCDRPVGRRIDSVVSVAHDIVVDPGGDHDDEIGAIRGAQYLADRFRIA